MTESRFRIENPSVKLSLSKLIVLLAQFYLSLYNIMTSRWYSTYCILYLTFWIQRTESVSKLNKRYLLFDNSQIENDLADFIYAKPFYPNENTLPKNTIIKNKDNDVTYLISKLSDDELIKLLNSQPKKADFNLNDVVKIVHNSQTNSDGKSRADVYPIKLDNKFSFEPEQKEISPNAFFKLEHRQINSVGSKSDLNYNALQKLNNLLYNYPQTLNLDRSSEDFKKKEQLFDILVSQLETLCCKKKSKSSKLPHRNNPKAKDSVESTNEYIFLIVNDEIKSNIGDDIISVDPDSLAKNSSVLLLGPISSPLSDGQLKFVVNRIAGELSKPEYLPLLYQLANGSLNDQTMRLMKSVVTGPETRRYIKPHRCNHQSKLAKVYGGPKWLICTGYLNVNGPSLYD